MRLPVVALLLLAALLLPAFPAGGDPGVTLPALLTDKLDNGLELVMLPSKAVPLVTLNIAVKTGAYTERKDNNGLSHLYEHMFFKGNESIPDQERYNERMRQLGIIHNGTTSTEGVQYFFTLPSRNLEAGMEFMAQALLTPKFDQEELEKERKVVHGEYDRNESTPTFHLNRAVSDTLFWKFPWRKNPIGARDVIAGATVAQMREFQKVFYLPNNSALIVVGDFDPAAVKALARKYLAAWKPGADPHDPPREPHPGLEASKTVIVNQPVPYAVLRLSTFGPDCRQDPEATFAADVFGTMLSLPSCRFQKNLVESRLVGGAHMGYYTQSAGGEINVYLQLRPQNILPARDAALAEIAAMGGPGYFTAEELANAKRSLVIDRLYEMEAGQGFSRNLAFWWVVGGLDYYLGYLDQVNRVTLEDVNRFVHRYVLGKTYVLGLLVSAEAQKTLGLDEKGLAGPARLGEGAASAEAPAKPPSGADEPASFEVAARDGARIPVIFRPMRENDVLAVHVFVRGGSLNITPEQGGVEHVLLQTMTKASERYPRETMEAELSRRGMSLSAESTYDYSVLQLKGLVQDAEKAVDLLQDVLIAPRLDAADFEEVRGQAVQTLQREEADPDDHVPHVANRGLFAGHPYLARPKGTAATVSALTRDDLVAHHRKIVRSNHLTVVVVGNLTRERVEKLMTAALQKVPKGEEAIEVPAFPAAGKGSVHIEDKEIPTCYILAKFVIPSPADPEFAATRLGLEVLSERLGDVIRTKHALSYAVHASSAQYRANYGVMYVTTTEPMKTLALMFAEVERMRREPVAAEFLREVANPMFTGMFMRDETNAGQAGSLGRAELVGVGWKNTRALAEQLFQATPDQVVKAMDRWLHHFHIGIIGPAGRLDRAKLEEYAK